MVWFLVLVFTFCFTFTCLSLGVPCCAWGGQRTNWGVSHRVGSREWSLTSHAILHLHVWNTHSRTNNLKIKIAIQGHRASGVGCWWAKGPGQLHQLVLIKCEALLPLLESQSTLRASPYSAPWWPLVFYRGLFKTMALTCNINSEPEPRQTAAPSPFTQTCFPGPT